VKPAWHQRLAEAAATPLPEGRRSALLFEHGSLELRHYAPRGVDPQTPHDREVPFR